jgi:hypothetical protein
MQQNPCGNAVSGQDLQAINAGKREVGETMDAKINNVMYMELYSGPKMMDEEYLKSNIARSIDRDSTVDEAGGGGGGSGGGGGGSGE